MQGIWIKDPTPIWDGIEQYMTDDSNSIETNGQFIGVEHGGAIIGAFLVRPWSSFCWEMHGGVPKEFWGHGEEICREAGMFLFRMTPAVKILAIIPEFNRMMRRCVKALGMKKEGVVTKSFMRGMKLHDQHIYGITRGEVCHQ